MACRRVEAAPVGYYYLSSRGTCSRRWGSRGLSEYVSSLPLALARLRGSILTAVGFIVLAVVIAVFFCLSTVHPPRKEIAVLSPTVCEFSSHRGAVQGTPDL